MRHAHPRLPAAFAVLLAAGAMGCGPDPVGIRPSEDTSRLFWSLSVDHRAVTLAQAAPHDRIEIAATPRSRTGDALEGLPAPIFKSLNPTIVGVTAEGLVTARARGTTMVVASLTAGNVTHHDTVTVMVTPTAPASPLDTLELIAPPLVTLGMYNVLVPPTMKARLTSASGTPITGASVVYRSLDPNTLNIERTTGAFETLRPGEVLVTATATAYGVTRHDTVAVTVLPAMLQVITTPPVLTADGRTVRAFHPGTATIITGGSVAFVNGSFMEYPTDSIDIVFDDPASAALDELACFCGTGNIAPFVTPPWQWFTQMRSFHKAGTYTYRSTITGQSGKIIVVDP